MTLISKAERRYRQFVRQMLAAKNFKAACRPCGRSEFALIDMHLHHDYDRGAKTPLQLLRQIRAKVAVAMPPEYNRFLNNFSHVFSGAYAAGYYSYNGRGAFADAYSLFEENGVLDSRTGTRFARRSSPSAAADRRSNRHGFRGRAENRCPAASQWYDRSLRSLPHAHTARCCSDPLDSLRRRLRAGIPLGGSRRQVHYTQTPATERTKRTTEGFSWGRSGCLQSAVRHAGGGEELSRNSIYLPDVAPPAIKRAPACQARGPFREVSVVTQKDSDEVKKLSGKTDLPLLMVGNQSQTGFQESLLNGLLDSAGYPTSVPPHRSRRCGR